MSHNTTPDPAPLRIDRSPTPKPIINLAELAEVLAEVPTPIRHRMPLEILATHLYGKACKKPRLIEEVEWVMADETARRTQPAPMAIAR